MDRIGYLFVCFSLAWSVTGCGSDDSKEGSTGSATATDAIDATDATDGTDANVETTLTLTLSNDSPLNLGAGHPVIFATGVHKDLVFAHQEKIRRYAPDGTLSDDPQPPQTISALHNTTDGRLLGCLIEEEHQLLLGELPSDTAPQKLGEVSDFCEQFVDAGDCWSKLLDCRIHESTNGKLLVLVTHWYGMNDAPEGKAYLGGEDTAFTPLEFPPLLRGYSLKDSALFSFGWGGNKDLVLGELYNDKNIVLATPPSMETKILIEGTNPHVFFDASGGPSWKTLTVAATPERSALVANNDNGVHVFGDSASLPLTTPLRTHKSADAVEVAVLNGAIAVAMHDETARTIEVNAGGESVVYTYDAALVDVLLAGIAVSEDRIHVLYRHWNPDDAHLEFDLITLKAVVSTP